MSDMIWLCCLHPLLVHTTLSWQVKYILVFAVSLLWQICVCTKHKFPVYYNVFIQLTWSTNSSLGNHSCLYTSIFSKTSIFLTVNTNMTKWYCVMWMGHMDGISDCYGIIITYYDIWSYQKETQVLNLLF